MIWFWCLPLIAQPSKLFLKTGQKKSLLAFRENLHIEACFSDRNNTFEKFAKVTYKRQVGTLTLKSPFSGFSHTPETHHKGSHDDNVTTLNHLLKGFCQHTELQSHSEGTPNATYAIIFSSAPSPRIPEPVPIFPSLL